MKWLYKWYSNSDVIKEREHGLIIFMYENVEIGLYLLYGTIGITVVKSEPIERPLFDAVELPMTRSSLKKSIIFSKRVNFIII